MSQFNDASSLWDLSLTPSLPALADDEFIALLQKQFGVGNDLLAKEFTSEAVGNVNPRALTRFPVQAVTPPSDDSSPSPPGGNQEPSQSRSRRESGLYDDDDDGHDDPALKRKASDEDLDDEPNHKSQHTCQSVSRPRRPCPLICFAAQLPARGTRRAGESRQAATQ